MAWAKGITGIEYVLDLGATPARVNHATGVIQVSLKHWNILPPEHRFFVLLHERWHILGRTDSEVKADEYAEREFVQMGYSPDEAVKTLVKLLNNNNPQHHWRIYLMQQMAKQYKQEHSGFNN